MGLENYRDVSRLGSDTGAGFQFEFSCNHCSRTWKSPFKPYRKGQLAGLIDRFAYFLGDRGSIGRASGSVAHMGADRARASALEEAIAAAEQRYAQCPDCDQTVCEDCWNSRSQRCERCSSKGSARSGGGGGQAASEGRSGGGASAMSCPNCRSSLSGGRFCAECGFDMASTHKSCPGCGVMCLRQARFCTDCGHGF